VPRASLQTYSLWGFVERHSVVLRRGALSTSTSCSYQILTGSRGPKARPSVNWSAYSMPFSAAHEQSPTSPVFETSKHCLCRRTSPVQRISILRVRLSRPRRSSIGIESPPHCLELPTGVFANLLPMGVCRKAFRRSEARSCSSSLLTTTSCSYQILTGSRGPKAGPSVNWSAYSMQCSAAHEQSATSPVFDTSNHCLCQRPEDLTSPTHQHPSVPSRLGLPSITTPPSQCHDPTHRSVCLL
jgi:hypothetical protein